MDNNSILTVSASPHISSSHTTRTIMLQVVIALLPAFAASLVFFGIDALLITLTCVAVAVVAEWGFEKICKKENTVGDLSAVVTGLLLGLNLPAATPLWQAAFGSLVAIVVVKQLFGGIGKNFANPAISARIIMFLSFSGTMSNFATDAISGATPLGQTTPTLSLTDMLLGIGKGGSIGETCSLALIVGGVFLIVMRVISWHIPVAFIGTVFLFTWACGADPLYQILSGGLMLGAIFMATDYTTSPSTPLGKIIFGIGCGLITGLIRMFGSYPEGVSFAILLMNIINPYICTLTRRKPLGAKKASKSKA